MSAPTLPTLAPGETYAGPVLAPDGSTRHHLILLAARPEQDLNWQAAKDWATSMGGELPDRQEQALLFANCKALLPARACWSGEEHAEDASYAWYCHFGYGYQDSGHKSWEWSAVAVRRSILEPFNPSAPAPAPQQAAGTGSTEALSAAQVKVIRTRLARWELDHLRKLAAQQAEQLDAASERIEALEAEVLQAWRTAESWQDDANELARDLQNMGAAVGLTQSGHLVALQGSAA